MPSHTQHINVVPRYDEIRAIQVDYLLSVLSSGGDETSKTIHKNLDEKIQRYAAGELKHAREAISLIWKSSRKPRDIDVACVPLDTASVHPPSDPEAAQRKRRVRTSLIKSIQGRSLLQRRYWVRTSQGGRICPIYFPGAVPSSVFSQAAARRWRYILGFTSPLNWTVMECLSTRAGRLEKNEEHEFSEDSDCESENELEDCPGTGNAGAGYEEQKLLPVLKVGSFAA